MNRLAEVIGHQARERLDLETLRDRVIGRMAALLEGQSRPNIFSRTLGAMVHDAHLRILERIGRALDDAPPQRHEAMHEIQDACERLDAALALLIGERARQAEAGALALRSVIEKFDGLHYAETLRHALHEARMRTPEGETVSAGMFIETVEKYGLGRELDRSIITQALHRMQAHRQTGAPPRRLFINLSAQEIQGRGVLAFAEALCNQLALAPQQLVFEVLERDAIGDMTNMRKFLANLRGKGFAFALDDFGSGYNSFHYLRELHFEYVKIDGAFVRNIVDSAIDRALVRNLAKLCQELGIRAVAESVESEDILTMLQEMGIDYVQGYHIGMPAADLAQH